MFINGLNTEETQEKQSEKKSESIRSKRDHFISETDYIVMQDYPVKNKQEWLDYRQALRDIPQQEGFPFDVVWPEKPEVVLEEE